MTPADLDSMKTDPLRPTVQPGFAARCAPFRRSTAKTYLPNPATAVQLWDVVVASLEPLLCRSAENSATDRSPPAALRAAAARTPDSGFVGLVVNGATRTRAEPEVIPPTRTPTEIQQGVEVLDK